MIWNQPVYRTITLLFTSVFRFLIAHKHEEVYLKSSKSMNMSLNQVILFLANVEKYCHQTIQLFNGFNSHEFDVLRSNSRYFGIGWFEYYYPAERQWENEQILQISRISHYSPMQWNCTMDCIRRPHLHHPRPGW